MCFFINSNSKLRKAKTPIRCYKVLLKTDYGFQSLFVGTPYEIGCTYKSKKWLSFKLFSWIYNIFYRRLNGEVIHAYTEKDNIQIVYRNVSNTIVTEWEIPKGTKYFVNNFFNEIVAPKMKFIKVLDYGK